MKLLKMQWHLCHLKYHSKKVSKFGEYEHLRKYHTDLANYHWDKYRYLEVVETI